MLRPTVKGLLRRVGREVMLDLPRMVETLPRGNSMPVKVLLSLVWDCSSGGDRIVAISVAVGSSRVSMLITREVLAIRLGSMIADRLLGNLNKRVVVLVGGKRRTEPVLTENAKIVLQESEG